MSYTGRPLHVLMAEDSPDDVFFTRQALKETDLRVDLSVVQDGAEALAFLYRQHPYESAPRPDLIVLDLNMPRMDGREALTRIKADPDLCAIPVVILTTSEAQEDVLQAYDLHANCFITKPADLDEFFEVVRVIEEFWLTVAQLPPD